jgi:hypothetical protein
MGKARTRWKNCCGRLPIAKYHIGKSLTTCTGWSRVSVTAAKLAAEKQFDEREMMICLMYYKVEGCEVAQLIEALGYKTEGRGFDFRWGLWDFSLNLTL